MTSSADGLHTDLDIGVEEASPAGRALGRTLGWCVGLGAGAGAAGGLAFLLQDDELRGAAVLFAVAGGLLGAVSAFFPAVPACLVLALAAGRSRSARGYGLWVTATVAAWAMAIPLVGLWLYRSFSYDLEDDQQALAVSLVVSSVVAEAMLVPMWRSLRQVRQAPMIGGFGTPAASQSAT